MNYTDQIDRATSTKDKPALAYLQMRLAGVFDLYSV
jgi:hypothetical protein